MVTFRRVKPPQTDRKFQVGILGGGQLARMLCLKAHEMGVPTAVLSASAEDPAAQVTRNWIQGSPSDLENLTSFLSLVSVATFESEFMDVELLTKANVSAQTQFYPSISHMALWQDRWSQKSALKKAKIPTADFVEVLPNDTYLSLSQKLNSPSFVIKKRFGGYDGYGTFVVHSTKDFKKSHEQWGATPSIAELFVPFRRELAITFARNSKGQVVHFPLVESFQHDSRCLWVKGPIQAAKSQPLIRSLSALLKKIRYVGVIAFEMFETKSGQFLVNEVAPRVHNSSHYTLDAFDIDQFSLHLKAILNQPLEKPAALTPAFAMYNLLGSGKSPIQLQSKTNAQIHWYGKKENKRGRKMGHVNAQAKSPALALKKAKAAAKDIRV